MPISVCSSSYSTRSAVRAWPSGAPGIWPVAVSGAHMTSTESMSRMTLDGGGCSPLEVHQDVDHTAVGVAHEEAADVPRLVGQRVDDLQPAADRLGVQPVDVLDLDRDVRLADPAVQTRLGPVGDRDLRRAVARAREHAEARLVHRDVEAEEARVELARGLEVVGDQVRDRAADRHRRHFPITPRRFTPPITPTQPWQLTQPMHPMQPVQPTFPMPPTMPAEKMTAELDAMAALPTTAAEPATPAEPTTPALPTTPADPTIPAEP